MRVMKSTLKRQKSVSSQAASISAWCAVFDWPSIVAAFSVERQGPASSSAARRKIAARSTRVHVGEDVALAVRHHGLEGLRSLDVLAADHQGDLDPVTLQLAQTLLQLRTLRRARRVVLDGFVSGLRRQRDRGATHRA